MGSSYIKSSLHKKDWVQEEIFDTTILGRGGSKGTPSIAIQFMSLFVHFHFEPHMISHSVKTGAQGLQSFLIPHVLLLTE